MDRHHIVSHPEGNTRIYHRAAFARFTGVDNIGLKHEGENPTGSFKDRGMTVAVSQARALGRKVLGCASTGNTSAALAAYAAQAEEMQALVFLPAGKVAPGKLAQAIAYGAKVVAVEGDFDAAMGLVKLASSKLGIYLVNSVNPFRLEGQKSVMWEMLEQLEWKVPDWVVVPGGNLGNTSAFGKALLEAYHAGWINRLPRIAVVQAAGASPFHRAFQNGFENFVAAQAETIATAIRIGNPVNFSKAFRVIQDLQGVVTAVTDPEILTAKSVIDGCGVGCEPASACSLAGVRKLVQQGVIKPHEQVIGVLTGHILKDPESVALSRNLPAGSMEADVVLSNNLEPLERFLQKS
jgi:threonine synthase